LAGPSSTCPPRARLHNDPESIIVCNGYKDRNYIRTALIGRKLGMTETTVKVHVREIMRKVGVSNRTQVAIADRRPQIAAEAERRLDGERPIIRLRLPAGPGSQALLDRLKQDWGAIGFDVERATSAAGADFTLIDQVAPSTSAAWFLRRFRCGTARVCDEQVDEMLDKARATPIAAERSALLLDASKRIDSLQLFIPLTAPIRWSLVSPRVTSFAGNRFGRHTLIGLEERLARGE